MVATFPRLVRVNVVPRERLKKSLFVWNPLFHDGVATVEIEAERNMSPSIFGICFFGIYIVVISPHFFQVSSF